MAIPLVAHEALTTAYMNDVDSLGVFAQQLLDMEEKEMFFLEFPHLGTVKIL